MKNTILPLFILFSLFSSAQQDTLPGFSVVNKGNNRHVISWYNKYPLVKQISVQRSADSLNNFKTILTVPDPMNRQNGFLDTKATGDKVFYRLYILVDGSNFIFTKSKRPAADSVNLMLKSDSIAQRPVTDSAYLKVVNKILRENLPDSMLTAEEIFILKKYRASKQATISDSVSKKIDKVLSTSNKPGLSVPTYRVLANKDGLVKIMLTDFSAKKYSVKFFEDDDTFLFEIKEIKGGALLMDKSNFHHAGWFKSELYENGRLVEKNRFFIPKDF